MFGRRSLIFPVLCSYLFFFFFAVWLFLTTGEIFCAPRAVFLGSPTIMARCLNLADKLITTTSVDYDDVFDVAADDDNNLENSTSLIAVYVRCDPRKKYRWAAIEKLWSNVSERYNIQLFFVVGRTGWWSDFRPAASNVLMFDFVDSMNALTEKMNEIFAHFIKLAGRCDGRRVQKVAIMLNDNIIVYPQRVIDGIYQMIPKNNKQPFIGGKIAEYGNWNVTWLLKTWYKPKIFGEFISGYAVIVNVQAAYLLHNALETFPVAYRRRFRLDDILITWFLADSLKIQRINTNMIGVCQKSETDGSLFWNSSLAIVHCMEIERDDIDRVLAEQNGENLL